MKYEGEYLKGKRHGKGKEYSYENGNLEFQGEYLNGEKNGKGKEYYNNGLLKFEGEYLNGERIIGKLYDNNCNIYCDLESTKGLIKEYYDNFDLMFEGEYLNGKRNGKGKEYYYNGKLEFEGEYLNGKRNGKGKEYYGNGKTKFEGLYNNGRIWSGIKYDLMNNKVYELKNGSGVIKDYDLNGILIVEGDYLNGEINGKVKGWSNKI